MSDATAISLAVEALEAQIKALQIDADLHDVWSEPQTGELIVQDFRTPRRIAAAKQRAQLRLAIVVLTQMRPEQRTDKVQIEMFT